jgi:nucleoside-diphosphate kinase
MADSRYPSGIPDPPIFTHLGPKDRARARVRIEQDAAKAKEHEQESAAMAPKEEKKPINIKERTFIAIKPDGVQRGLIGPIISRFENRGFKLVAMKLVKPGKEHLETHYEDLKELPFYKGMIEYMVTAPICAMVWEGANAVAMGRAILGETDPAESAPGTIRFDYCLIKGRNVCHGSDTNPGSAEREIALWFKPEELLDWKLNEHEWLYEN